MIFMRSIRWRLQAWHALLLTLVVTGFGITAYKLVSIQKLREVDEQLQADAALLGIAFPPVPSRSSGVARPPPRPGGSLVEQITAHGSYFVVWNSDGSEQARSAHAPSWLHHRPTAAGSAMHGGDRWVVNVTGAGRCFLVGRPVLAELASLRQLSWYLTAAGAAVLGGGLAGGGWLAARAIRPLAVISATAEKIATGDLAQRIPAVSEDELGVLTQVLNSTFARLEAAFAQQARFTADAAHELRTPVSAVLMHAQNGLASEALSEEQREAFSACERAAQRMKRLIESLLELSRMEAGQESLLRERCDLADVAQDCVDLVHTLAQARHITLETRLEAAPCLGDAERLGQVVVNLLGNALEHAQDRVVVATSRSAGQVLLTVADNGPGIPAEHLPRVFERFYRVDASRHSTQHNGLGLAISKAIVEGHGGTLSVRPLSPSGVCFEVRLANSEAQ